MERLCSHRRASVVRLLGQRALTWRLPAKEAHLYADYVAVLWNRPHDAGCFTDYILRHTFDKETYRQLRECMQRFDTGRYCTFGHICVNNVRIPTTKSGEGLTYVHKKDRYFLNPQWMRDYSGITCHCPQVTSSNYDLGELITICCLKHYNFQIIEPTFRRFIDFYKDTIWMWLRLFADEEET
jgi:hypothetical protein